ncbi:hypothetical protein ELI_0625 [Eubacterium callanderi]|uniref:Uncharacterized protein n=1 Tax=Eubacterium callanderi TaxID=53442 RepID=E3GJ06_9FIRM|nr:hypothetical protein ELI_0625 [Eubacterium callanderi]
MIKQGLQKALFFYLKRIDVTVL